MVSLGGVVQFSQRNDDSLQAAIRELVEAAGMSMVEYVLSRHRGSVQLRLSVYRKGSIGLDDCSRIHRAIQPRVELAFPDQEVFLEVASPGVDRQIRDASEFPLYIGRGVRCYSIETSDWVSGLSNVQIRKKCLEQRARRGSGSLVQQYLPRLD